MKQFWVFAGDTYYPQPGAYDFVASFETLQDARNHIQSLNGDWAHIFDAASTAEIVIEEYHRAATATAHEWITRAEYDKQLRDMMNRTSDG